MKSEADGRKAGRNRKEQAGSFSHVVFGAEVHGPEKRRNTRADLLVAEIAVFPLGAIKSVTDRGAQVKIPFIPGVKKLVKIIRTLQADGDNCFAVRIIAERVVGST